MVTLGSLQPANFETFHGASSAYDDALNFCSFELALNDAADMATTTSDNAAGDAPYVKPARRQSVSALAPLPPDRSGLEHTAAEAGRSNSSRRNTYTQSSAPHRLFRAAKPELKSWNPHSALPTSDDSTVAVESSAAVDAARSRVASWHAAAAAAAEGSRSPGSHGTIHQSRHQNQETVGISHGVSPRSPRSSGRGSRDDSRPSNEILDGSDVLQQISNLTSTEPSNEREVFVGGLRESEDAVHITEEELATYFSKFGVIESVSINRDDRTHRGRGFAFVKFFQERAALDAVVADSSTHVIRGTTVSVQWSRGAKDAGGERPRRRNSGTSATSSGNGSSPSRANSRSSPKMVMFSNGHGKAGGNRRGGGGGGGGSCGTSCGRGFSPMRSRSQGHLVGSGMPYGFSGDHMNQPMVCVVVPAQRAAALGLSHLPTHRAIPSRGSPPRDIHFTPLAQAPAPACEQHSGGSYPPHTRSHSHTPMSVSGHGVVGGGFGHHSVPQVGADQQRHGINVPPHHVPREAAGHSRGASLHASMQVPSSSHQAASSGGDSRRGRTEPRGYNPSAQSQGSTRSSASSGRSSLQDYERSKYELCLSSTSYPPQGWSGGDVGGGVRGMREGAMRSQSPPTMMRSSAHGRSGGGAPRPPPSTPSRGYDNQYPPTRFNAAGGSLPVGGGGGGGLAMTDGFSAGIGMNGRRHSGSSVMSGRASMRQKALAATSHYYSVGDIGNEHAYDRDYGYADHSRLS